MDSSDQTHSNAPRWRTAGVNKLLQFVSVAALTQITLMLSQIILLPIQIRVWGHTATAAWYSAIALATITSVVDCGLRTAGHSEILRFAGHPADDLDARDYFHQVWGWIRVLVLGVTIALIIGDALFTTLFRNAHYPFWKAALTLAYALETLLIIRIVYLDTLGYYRRAEASYFLFAALRLAFAIPSLLLLRLQANGLAWLFLITSVLALALQGRLCPEVGVVGIFTTLPRRLSVKVFAVARHTLAEPCANWVRLSLPVLVIAAIASPASVTTYVALRAAFGAARATIQQLARFTSVEYLRLHAARRTATAESLLSIFLLLAVFCGTAVAAVVVVDNLRLLGLWLAHFDRATFQIVALSFAFSSSFYAYQIIVLLMFRMGQLAWIARRHWAYVIYSVIFAALASQAKSLSFYLVALTLSEVVLSTSFLLLGAGKKAAIRKQIGRRSVLAAFAGSGIVVLLWVAARQDFAHIFVNFSFFSMAWTAGILVLALAVHALFSYLSNTDTFKFAILESTEPVERPAVSEGRLAKSNI